MKLYDNWKTILTKAWSIRFMIIAGILSAGELVLPLYMEALPRDTFAILSAFFCCSALIARLVAQKDM